MQDRYFGDIGDFAKFGLLRALVGDDPCLCLGVLWYRVPDEPGTNDGRHIEYLEPSPKNMKRFRGCDPVLYDKLGELVRAGKRTVSAVAEHSVLPLSTVYHDVPLTFTGVRNGDKPAHRERWLTSAYEAVDAADVMFLDPDNGLEVGCDRHSSEGPKYVFYDDLVPLSQSGKTIIVYQHANHDESFADHIQRRFLALQERLARPADALFALRWRRVNARAFIFVLNGCRQREIPERLNELLVGPWGAHFELVEAKG